MLFGVVGFSFPGGRSCRARRRFCADQSRFVLLVLDRLHLAVQSLDLGVHGPYLFTEGVFDHRLYHFEYVLDIGLLLAFLRDWRCSRSDFESFPSDAPDSSSSTSV